MWYDIDGVMDLSQPHDLRWKWGDSQRTSFDISSVILLDICKLIRKSLDYSFLNPDTIIAGGLCVVNHVVLLASIWRAVRISDGI